MAAAAPLEFAGVTVCRGATVALDGVDLTLTAGSVLALLGPNGAGKSTLVGAAAGLLRPASGAVRLFGADPARDRAAVRQHLGLAAQDVGVYPSLTVLQNLAAAGEFHGLGAARARRRAHELLEPLALADLAGVRAGRLSGGQRRRLHAAVALVNRPRVVLLDEPTAGADPATRSALLRAVGDLAADGASVLYITHYLPEVEELGAEVALLLGGRVRDRAPLPEFVARHARPALRLGFDGPAPDWLEGGRLAGGDWELACADPEAALARVAARWDADGPRLRSARIMRPTLEAAFAALTGGAPEGGGEEP